MPRKSKHAIPEEKLEIMQKIIQGYNVQTTTGLQEALIERMRANTVLFLGG